MTKEKIKIRTSNDTIEDFDKNKIKETLVRETKTNNEDALKIAEEVKEILTKTPLDYITSPMVREITNAVLLEKGYDTIRNKHTRFGVTSYDIENLVSNGNKDNANMAQNPETIHKYVADEGMKQYTLLNILPKRLADSHLNGDLHCLSGRNNIIYKDKNGIHIERIDTFCEHKAWEQRTVKVPSVNVDSGKISWQKVVNGKKTGHKPCFEITFGKGLQIECTGDHKLFTYQSGLHQFGKEITPETYTSGQRIGTINKIDYNGREDRYNYSALYGMFLGDGFYQNGKLQFHFKKQEKIDYVESLLNELNYEYHTVCNEDNSIVLIVDSIVDFNKSKENLFHDGFVGNMKGLLEGLINSDGYITKHGIYNKPYLEFTNTNKEICDWFNLTLLTLGLRPSFQSYINTKGNPYYKCVISGDEIVRVLVELNLREPYKSLVSDYFNNNLISGKLFEHTGLFINDIKPTGEKDVYNITVENNHNFLTGIRGFILVSNCHDLEYFGSRPLNCLQHDLRLFIRFGLKVDGTGDHTSIAAPPTHMETVMNHSGEILLAAQQNMSGGQAFSLWNVFVAPFAHGVPYERIKQCVEMFIFNLNMAYAARGGQVPFTSVGLEFTVPDFLKNETAYGPGGKACGVYGDYEEEVRLIQRAFTEVLLEGDANGKPHLFPNTIYYLREECLKPEFEEDIDKVHYLSAKFGTAYYINMLPKYMGKMANYMGCRTRLSDNWTGDWETDTLRCGNLAYVTMNLPRMAYKARNEEEMFDILDETMNKAEEILLIRRERALKCLNEYKILPFLTQKFGGEPYYRVENSTLSFGFCGLNEMLLSMTGGGIANPESNKLGHKVIDHINDRINELKGETPYRWSIIQTPAESTAYRFATIDRKMYPDKVICNGDSSASYYTNSNHLPVDTSLSLPEKIKIESEYHPKTQGGHIFHAFMGESYSDPDSLRSLTDKICRNSDIGFWAYSSALSYCNKCGTIMKGLQETCTHCGETREVEWYDRITGYVQQVGHSKSASSGWNAGKKQELIDRRRFEQ